MTARILVVEDDPASLAHLASMLASWELNADTAVDGFSALRLAQDRDYDLVLVDYHLPDMAGYAFARMMRTVSSRRRRPLKMIAMTEAWDCLAARRGGDAVFDHMLIKPLDPAALCGHVASLTASGSPQFEALGHLAALFQAAGPLGAHPASHVLWRIRGLSRVPNATIVPEPSRPEFQRLSTCFSAGTPETADCIVLLSEEGLEELAALRERGPRYLLPVFGSSKTLQAACDHLFNPADPQSWTETARIIKNVQLRTVLLKPEIRMSEDAALRILAYLFVSERPLCLRRDVYGETIVSRTAGFDPNCIIASLRSLAAQGLVTSRPGRAPGQSSKDLEVLPNERGLARILDERMTASHSHAS